MQHKLNRITSKKNELLYKIPRWIHPSAMPWEKITTTNRINGRIHNSANKDGFNLMIKQAFDNDIIDDPNMCGGGTVAGSKTNIAYNHTKVIYCVSQTKTNDLPVDKQFFFFTD